MVGRDLVKNARKNINKKIKKELKKTVVFVTHDFEEALLLGDRIAVLSDQSKVEQYGTPLEILSNPKSDKVKSFVGDSASVRMLALVPISSVTLLEGSVDGPALSEKATLREAMDQFIQGHTKVNVGNNKHLTFVALQKAISNAKASVQ